MVHGFLSRVPSRSLNDLRSAVVETGAWLLFRRRRFRVRGRSMVPTIEPGAWVLVDRERRPTVGDIVLAPHPWRERTVCKRLAALDGAFAELASDNPDEGTDSRQFGPVAVDDLLGVVTWVFGAGPPAPRPGPAPSAAR